MDKNAAQNGALPEGGLKAPSALQTILGALHMAFFGAHQVTKAELPEKFGAYSLVKKIKKEDDIQNIAIGIYESAGKKYIIKRWEGTTKDLNYYSLRNECAVNSLMSSVGTKSGAQDGIYFPAVEGYYADTKSLTVAFEFIDGTLLSAHPLEFQAKTLTAVMQHISKLSTLLSHEQKAMLGRRSLGFYLLLLPLISILLSVRSPKNAKVIWSAFGASVSKISKLATSPLTLAHRDLTPSNIMVTDKGICVLDAENMLLTLSGYDYAFISVTPGMKELASRLPGPSSANAAFLKNYIVLHHILGSGEFLVVNEEYLSVLRDLHQ
ncbi:MAG: hypothetical protein JWO00_132 [Candidatus Parcubacteria bacterium]|nr:hypothetical protein [Candidatus Parcubacteria bacterium]